MRDDLLAAIKPREETVKLGKNVLTVRELETAADVAAFQDGGDMAYKLLVRCTFDAEGASAFTDDDIPAIKRGSKVRLAGLIAAVIRVNGFDAEDNVKNSAAVPGSG